MRFNVTVTRVESFCIEADSADSAVEAAFDLTTHHERDQKGKRTKYGATVLAHDWETIVAHDWETIEHTVEEDTEVVAEPQP